MASSAGTADPPLDPLEAAHARVGSLLDAKWQLDGLLGRGGMATVYAATNRSTKARVAIKVLLAEFAQDLDVRERFVREARIANSIDHPACVAVLDEGLSDRGEIFLVMELLEGTTLDAYVRSKGPKLSFEQKLAFFEPVLEVLGECHAAGIIHRDIKPANIFLTSKGQVKVLDFGIARLRETKSAIEATKQGTVLGTPAYMSPEQALGLGDLVDGRSDLWSVGACIYTLISGRRVHHARSENESMVMAATRSAGSLAIVAPEMPVEVVTFVDKALAHDKAHRFADARAMRGALGALLAAIRSGLTTGPKRTTGDAVVVRTDVTRDLEAEQSAEVRAQTLELLRSIWKHLAHFLSASGQYGPQHSLAIQPMRVALEEIGAALAQRPDCLVWDVGPFSFGYAKTPLWDAEKLAMERASFRVFSHGMRKMQFKAGVTENEIRRFLAIITRDKAAGITLTDDPVADLWAQRFDHIGHVAIDVFANGTAEDIEGFETEMEAITGQAQEVSMVAKGWDDGGNDPVEAQALQANLLDGLNAAVAVASSIALDAQTRMLGGQVVLTEERWEERFVDVLAAAVLEGTVSGDADAVLGALGSWTSAAIARGQLVAAFDRFARLATTCARAAPEAAREAEQLVARTMFDPSRLGDVLNKVRDIVTKPAPRGEEGPDSRAAPPGADPSVVSGVERVLALLDDASVFESAVLHWVTNPDARVSAALFTYVSRWAKGREAKLGPIVEREAPRFALAALELLKAGDAKEADAAIASGLRSSHPEVRRAALRSLRGEEGGGDLLRLLSDPELDLRCEVLGIIAKLRVRTAGPAVVRRIQDPSFQALESREKREWLACLQVLNPTRAEEIVIEMLARAPMIASEVNDRNRVIAAQVLAGADTETALAAAKTAARAFWWNSAPVREAAAAAVAAISARRDAKGQK